MRKTAIIVLVNKDEILLQKRDNNPNIVMPGYWGLPGGMIENGESPKQAIIRECQEETGYKLKDPKFLRTILYEVNGERIKGYIYYSKYDKKQEIKCFEGQKMEFKSLAEFKNLNAVEYHYEMALQALEIHKSGQK